MSHGPRVETCRYGTGTSYLYIRTVRYDEVWYDSMWQMYHVPFLQCCGFIEFDADPDHTIYFDADPDLTIHFAVHPDLIIYFDAESDFFYLTFSFYLEPD